MTANTWHKERGDISLVSDIHPMITAKETLINSLFESYQNSINHKRDLLFLWSGIFKSTSFLSKELIMLDPSNMLCYLKDISSASRCLEHQNSLLNTMILTLNDIEGLLKKKKRDLVSWFECGFITL